MLKKYFKQWNLFEKLFTLTAVVSMIIFAVIWKSWWVELTASVLSIIWIMLIAKGKVEGYVVGFLATILYAWVSVFYRYYGELLISIFITTPLNVYGFIQWVNNRRQDKKLGKVVVVGGVQKKELVILLSSQLILSVGYYFLLKVFNTEFLLVSTISICTSTIGTYLLLRRSDHSWIAWILNAIIQVVLWTYILIVFGLSSFVMFWFALLSLLNNVYGYISWIKLKKSQ